MQIIYKHNNLPTNNEGMEHQPAVSSDCANGSSFMCHLPSLHQISPNSLCISLQMVVTVSRLSLNLLFRPMCNIAQFFIFLPALESILSLSNYTIIAFDSFHFLQCLEHFMSTLLEVQKSCIFEEPLSRTTSNISSFTHMHFHCLVQPFSSQVPINFDMCSRRANNNNNNNIIGCSSRSCGNSSSNSSNDCSSSNIINQFFIMSSI
jgi:hypothetical protein